MSRVFITFKVLKPWLSIRVLHKCVCMATSIHDEVPMHKMHQPCKGAISVFPNNWMNGDIPAGPGNLNCSNVQSDYQLSCQSDGYSL